MTSTLILHQSLAATTQQALPNAESHAARARQREHEELCFAQIGHFLALHKLIKASISNISNISEAMEDTNNSALSGATEKLVASFNNFKTTRTVLESVQKYQDQFQFIIDAPQLMSMLLQLELFDECLSLHSFTTLRLAKRPQNIFSFLVENNDIVVLLQSMVIKLLGGVGVGLGALIRGVNII